VREEERGREKGYGCINFSAQTEPNPVLYFYSVSGGLRYNYTVKRAGVAIHTAEPKTSIWAGVWVQEYTLGENSEFCDRPKMLQNKFKKNGNLLSYTCLCKRQICEKVQRSILLKLLDMRCLVPLAELTYPDFFSAVQEIKHVLAHHLLALSLT